MKLPTVKKVVKGNIVLEALIFDHPLLGETLTIGISTLTNPHNGSSATAVVSIGHEALPIAEDVMKQPDWTYLLYETLCDRTPDDVSMEDFEYIQNQIIAELKKLGVKV